MSQKLFSSRNKTQQSEEHPETRRMKNGWQSLKTDGPKLSDSKRRYGSRVQTVISSTEVAHPTPSPAALGTGKGTQILERTTGETVELEGCLPLGTQAHSSAAGHTSAVAKGDLHTSLLIKTAQGLCRVVRRVQGTQRGLHL